MDIEPTEENTAPNGISAPTSVAESTSTAQLTSADADRIQMEEFERLQRKAIGEDTSTKAEDPNAAPKEDKPRASDGKFLPKSEEVGNEKKETPSTATVADKTPPVAKAEPPKVSSPEIPAFDMSAPLLDMKAILSEVDAEVNGRKYKDAPGADGSAVEISGEQAFSDYGQITEPMRDRQNLALEKMAQKIEGMLRPVLAAAQAQEQENTKTEIQRTIDAVVSAGVPDASELFADPRMAEWAGKNPQYAGLLVADPNRAEDIAWAFEKFRASIGGEKPSATSKSKTPQPVAQRPRSVLAGISTARGSGAREEGGSISGTPEQIMEAEFTKLQKRQQEAERLAGSM